MPLCYKRYFMKCLALLFAITSLIIEANAQTSGGTNQSGAQKKSQLNKQEKKRIQRGSGLYHGSKDTTAGSPMGTGGAGGDMSGSPAGSAIETDDQTNKADAGRDSTGKMGETTGTVDSTANAPATRKTRASHKSRRGTL